MSNTFFQGGEKFCRGSKRPPGYRPDCSHLLWFPFAKKYLRKLMQWNFVVKNKWSISMFFGNTSYAGLHQNFGGK